MNHERFIQLDPGAGRSPVPVNYVRNLVELIAEVGVDSRRLLSQVGLSEDEVYNPEPALRFEQFRRVMVGAREITGDPALGLALVAAFVLFSFVGTGSSFLAMAIFADRVQLAPVTPQPKSFYFLGGLTEGTETIIFIAAICLMPGFFNLFGVIFGLMCCLTIYTRIHHSYHMLKAAEPQ